jgi:hypothetical protein
MKNKPESHAIMLALAAAVHVDREQGFRPIKLGTNSNHALTANLLRSGEFSPTPDDILEADKIYDHFSEIIVMGKLSESLTKRRLDGGINRYDADLAKLLSSKTVNCHKDLVMIASLPHSLRIADIRDRMARFVQDNRRNGYIGELNNRAEITGEVMDLKVCRRYRYSNDDHYIATVLTTDNKVAKFFVFPKRKDVPDIVSTTITFQGTIRSHEINPRNDCQETMFRRAKIQ